MGKFVKKPVIIEAYQTEKEMNIETLEGTMKASAGDWIIKGVHGELYPCKPDIFEKTYTPIEDNPTNKLQKAKEQIEEILKNNDLRLISEDEYCGVVLFDNKTGEFEDMEYHPLS